MYAPPFSITPEIINRLASVAAKAERYAVRMEQRDALRLRKANRIKTIHSSLAIEGNELTEADVRDILNGQPVIAPARQIQEVRNAIQAYQLHPRLDAFSLQDFLQAHRVMMDGLQPDAGQLRRKGVGVFAEGRVIHMAPPADRVEGLVGDLFAWLRNAKDHLILRSCVFHYELEFIHPFSDGNGRMGRLWQSLILAKYHPVFSHLPIETMVYDDTDAYYDAISASTAAGESTPFIEFMLAKLDDALTQGSTAPTQRSEDGSLTAEEEEWDYYFSRTPGKGWGVGVNVEENVGVHLNKRETELLRLLRADSYATAKSLAPQLGVTSRQVERLLAKLKKAGLLTRIGADKNGRWCVTSAPVR